jgi:DNA-binding response OmpR family regulator
MNRKICIVEDTPDLLENLSTFMTLEGFDVIACDNGAEALEKLKEVRPDLIITDIWMPLVDGFELIEKLKSDPDLSMIPVAVFSAAPLEAKEKNTLQDKVVGYIPKPVSMEEFLVHVETFLKKENI